MEHLQHFGLSEDPFQNEPRLRDFQELEPHRIAIRRLERGLRQHRGLLVLTGELGAGKTMVVRRLLESLEEEVFEASMLVVLNGAADTNWMLTRFAKQLGIEEPSKDREVLLGQVYEQLAIIREDGRHAVVIIDDAHLLSSGDTLAEVCGLLKLEYEERRLFSLVLTGEEMLDAAILADPTLAHRMDVRVRMGPLPKEVAVGYVGHRVRQAGGTPAILDPDAAAALAEYGRGLPGRMNTLADNALFAAFLCGRDRITRADVERAHEDLAWEHVVKGLPPAGAVPAQPEIPLTEPAPPAAGPIAADPGASLDGSLFENPGDSQLGSQPVVRGPGPVAEATVAMGPANGNGNGEAELEILDADDSSGGLTDLDSDLEAIFEEAQSESPDALTRQALEAPPKAEEDLVVELLDD
ncbi:MAG: AAA family ATPase [Myxococcota bacterium]|nr:AAA family ATPase [Myxococcota bacterium]